MSLNELKTKAAELGITPEEARAHGKLTAKATWEAAIEAAKQPAQDAAEAFCDVVYSRQSRDIVQWVAAAVLMAVFTLGLLAYRITQALWRLTAPHRQKLIRRRDDWLTAQASYAALVLLLLKSA
jgi:hypothetical protein